MNKDLLYQSFVEKGEKGFTVVSGIRDIREGEQIINLAKALESDGKIILHEYGFQADSVYLIIKMI